MWKKINWSKWMCVLTKTMTNKQMLCDLLPAFIKWKVYHFLLSGVKECMYLYEQMSAKCEASTFQNNFIPLLKKKKKISAKCHWLSSPMFFVFFNACWLYYWNVWNIVLLYFVGWRVYVYLYSILHICLFCAKCSVMVLTYFKIWINARVRSRPS